MTMASSTDNTLRKIQSQAREWAIALSDEAIDGGKLRQFQQWRSRSPHHEAAFQEADRLWRGMEQMTHLREYAALPESEIKTEKHNRRFMINMLLCSSLSAYGM